MVGQIFWEIWTILSLNKCIESFIDQLKKINAKRDSQDHIIPLSQIQAKTKKPDRIERAL